MSSRTPYIKKTFSFYNCFGFDLQEHNWWNHRDKCWCMLATTMTDTIIFSKIFTSWRSSKSPSSFARYTKLLIYSKNSAMFIMQRCVGGGGRAWGRFPYISFTGDSIIFCIFLSKDLLELILVISPLSVLLNICRHQKFFPRQAILDLLALFTSFFSFEGSALEAAPKRFFLTNRIYLRGTYYLLLS